MSICVPGPSKAALPSLSSRLRHLLAGLGLVAGLVSAAQATDPVAGSFRPSADQLTALNIVPITRHDFRLHVVAEGRIAQDDDHATPVYSPYSGRVTAVVAVPGQAVKAGDVLARVESQEVIQGRSDLLVAQAALQSAQAQAHQAEILEGRKHAMYEARSASLQDWEQSQSDLVVARSAVDNATAGLNAARGRLAVLGVRPERVESWLAGGADASSADIVAPIAGTVVSRQIGVGQFIQSGAANPVFVVADLSTVWIEASVREMDAGLVHVGDEIRLDLPGQLKRPVRGRIHFVSAQIDPDTHRQIARARAPNPGGFLVPGTLGRARIESGQPVGAPGVPRSAIIQEGADARVWVQNADGSLSSRLIRLGVSDGDLVEVRSGLHEGDKVVSSGALFIDRAAQND